MWITVAHKNKIFDQYAVVNGYYGTKGMGIRLNKDAEIFLDDIGEYKYDSNFVYFHSYEDALAFRLRWC